MDIFWLRVASPTQHDMPAGLDFPVYTLLCTRNLTPQSHEYASTNTHQTENVPARIYHRAGPFAWSLASRYFLV